MGNEIIKKRIDIDNLQYILDCFTELTSIRVAYIDNDKELLIGKNRIKCDFCSEIRKNKKVLDACLYCDNEAFNKAQNTRELYLYRCHIGLWEAVVPLYIRDSFEGCIMFGQINNEEEPKKLWEYTKACLIKYDDSFESSKDLPKLFKRINIIKMDKIKAAARMLEMMAIYISDNDMIKVIEPENLEIATDYIIKNFNKKITILDIAKTAGLSTSYLSFLFHKKNGYTISSYLEKLRIERAKDELISTFSTVRQIASNIGYEDQNYFSRVFKKNTGYSPKEYRKIKRLTDNNFE